MAVVAAASSTLPVDLPQEDPTVEDLCNRFALDPVTVAQAKRLLANVHGARSKGLLHRDWTAPLVRRYQGACVFLAAFVSVADQNEVSIVQILRAVASRLQDFIGALQDVASVSHAETGSMDKHLADLAETCQTTLQLFRHYERLFVRFIAAPLGQSAAVGATAAIDVPVEDSKAWHALLDHEPQDALFGFGWLLFLVAKRTIFDSRADLATSHTLLLAVMHWMVRTLRRGSSTSPGVPQDTSGLLAALCAAAGTSGSATSTALQERVRVLEARSFTPLMAELFDKRVLLTAPPNTSPKAAERAGASANLMLPAAEHAIGAQLFDNINRLGAHYDELVRSMGGDQLPAAGTIWVDERQYLQERREDTAAMLHPAEDGAAPEPGTHAQASSATAPAGSAVPDAQEAGFSSSSGTAAPAVTAAAAAAASTPVNGSSSPTFQTPQRPSHSGGPAVFGASPARTWHEVGSDDAGHSRHALVFAGLYPMTQSPLSRRALASQSSVPGTPVSRMLAEVTWLQHLLDHRDPGLGARLTTMLTECKLPVPLDSRTEDSDQPVSSPLRMLRSALDLVTAEVGRAEQRLRFPTAASMDSLTLTQGQGQAQPPGGAAADLPDFKRELALKLYYWVLEAMVKSETARLGASSLSAELPAALAEALGSRSLHRGLLAVCFEVVIAAYRVPGFEFPHVLQALGAATLDIVKSGEIVLRLLPSVPARPRSIITHLGEVEMACIEAHAWRSTEQLLALSIKHKQYLASTFAGALSVRSLPPPSPQQTQARTAQQPPASPLKSVDTGAQAAHPRSKPATPQKSDSKSPPVMPAGAFPVVFFYRKLFALAADRLELLSSETQLGLAKDIQPAIWAVVRFALLERSELMENRHLDTLLLCAVYAVCTKVANFDLKFRHIIAVYSAKFPGKATKVVRAIPLPNAPPADIINFYNKMFIPQLKEFLQHIRPQVRPGNGAAAAPASTGSPVAIGSYPLVPLPRRQAVQSVSNRTQVFVVNTVSSHSPSPLRASAPGGGSSTGKAYSTTFKSFSGAAMSPAGGVSSMSPRTRGLYAFGESPISTLVNINRMMTGRRLFAGPSDDATIAKRANAPKGSVKRGFDAMTADGTGTASKRKAPAGMLPPASVSSKKARTVTVVVPAAAAASTPSTASAGSSSASTARAAPQAGTATAASLLLSGPGGGGAGLISPTAAATADAAEILNGLAQQAAGGAREKRRKLE